MSCYDFFVGTCPKCGSRISCQTKLFGRDFKKFEKTSKVPWESDDLIGLKEPCPNCKTELTAIIVNKIFEDFSVFEGFSLEEPNAREGYFGELLMPNESREEQFKRLVKEELESSTISLEEK